MAHSRTGIMPSPGPASATDRALPSRRRHPDRERQSAAEAPDTLLCLDIETVADTDMPVVDPDRFPKPCWHRIVAISYVEARIAVDPATGHERYLVRQCRSGGNEDWDERRLLTAFWKFFAAGRYRIVTWNGRSFDVPVLQARALIHGIPVQAWYCRGDRWNGYGSRYAPDWHTDLMDVLSGFGASPRMGLDECAVALGLPGKAGEHGAHVADQIARGDLAGVRAYCETDTLNSMALYVRHALLCGKTDAEGHDASLRSLVDYLAAEGRTRPHLRAFLDRWMSSSRPAPMFVADGA
ncbi:3'-5' exonuclease [Methylobacterium sp. 2A]|jgi:3'-5' exonuclease|nr:3'-5' exonuclease [Methylobacterium sp. 2A]